MKHSKVGASGYYRWSKCPGSVKLSEGVKQVTSPYAAEGTEAHDLAEKMLKAFNGGYKLDLTKYDPEMVEHVQLYVDTVLSCLKPGDTLLIEEKVNLNWLYRGLYGTNDAMIKSPSRRKLFTFDLKFGKGKIVEVEENGQLLYYAADEANKGDYEEVEMVIVQPRAYHPDGPVRRWAVTGDDVISWAHNVLRPAASACFKKDAPLKSGSHCDFCPAIGKCPEIHKTAMEVAQADFAPDNSTVNLPEPETLKHDQLLKILHHGDIIVKYINKAYGYALQLAEQGTALPGFKLVKKKSNRKWVNEEEVRSALYLCTDLEFNEINNVKLKSPNQIEQLIKKKKIEKEDWLTDLWTKPDTGVTLVREDDKRDAAIPSAIEDFK